MKPLHMTLALALSFISTSCISTFSGSDSKVEKKLLGNWLILGSTQSAKGEITYLADGKCMLTMHAGIEDYRCGCTWEINGADLLIATTIKSAQCPVQPATTLYTVKSFEADDLYLIVEETGEIIHERRLPK